MPHNLLIVLLVIVILMWALNRRYYHIDKREDKEYLSENLDLSIYRKLMNFIYDLSCFNSMTKCNECSQCKECRYYLMTGENFRFYPGILVKSDMFGKSHFRKNEQKRFEFYFIGNNKSYSDYVYLLFSNLNQSLLIDFQ